MSDDVKKSDVYYCYGCGKTFTSMQSVRSHVGRCYWYRWFKENNMIDRAPFYPDNLIASLEFMRRKPVNPRRLRFRYPSGDPGPLTGKYD